MIFLILFVLGILLLIFGSQGEQKPPQSSSTPSPSSSKSATSSSKSPPDSSPTYSKPPQSSPSLAPSSSKPLPSSPKPVPSHKPSLSSPKVLPSSSGPSPFRQNGPPSSSRPPPSSPSQNPTCKPILYPAPSDGKNEERTMSFVLGKSTSPIYAIPEDIKDLVKKDMVPAVLKHPLSPSTYKHYFAALLYAEDFYLEKWSDFQLKNVILELHEAEIKKRSNKYKDYNGSVEKDDKIFVEFEIDSIPEKRPFLLSRHSPSLPHCMSVSL